MGDLGSSSTFSLAHLLLFFFSLFRVYLGLILQLEKRCSLRLGELLQRRRAEHAQTQAGTRVSAFEMDRMASKSGMASNSACGSCTRGKEPSPLRQEQRHHQEESQFF